MTKLSRDIIRAIVRDCLFPRLAERYDYDVCLRLALVCRDFAQDFADFIAMHHLPRRLARLYRGIALDTITIMHVPPLLVSDVDADDMLVSREREVAPRDVKKHVYAASTAYVLGVYAPRHSAALCACVNEVLAALPTTTIIAGRIAADARAGAPYALCHVVDAYTHVFKRAPRLRAALFDTSVDYHRLVDIVAEHRVEFAAARLLYAAAFTIFGMRLTPRRDRVHVAGPEATFATVPSFVDETIVWYCESTHGIRFERPVVEALLNDRTAPTSHDALDGYVECARRYTSRSTEREPLSEMDAPLLKLLSNERIWTHTRLFPTEAPLVAALFMQALDARRASRKRRGTQGGVFLIADETCDLVPRALASLVLYSDFSSSAGGLVLAMEPSSLLPLTTRDDSDIVDSCATIRDYGSSKYSRVLAVIAHSSLYNSYEIRWSHAALALTPFGMTMRCALLSFFCRGSVLAPPFAVAMVPRCTHCNHVLTAETSIHHGAGSFCYAMTKTA